MKIPKTIVVTDSIKPKIPVSNVGEINPNLKMELFSKVYEKIVENLTSLDMVFYQGNIEYDDWISSDGHYQVRGTWYERKKLSMNERLNIMRRYWGGDQYFEAVQVQPNNMYEVANKCGGQILYYEDGDPGPGWILLNPDEPYRAMIAGLGDYIVQTEQGLYFMMPATQFREVFKQL